MGRKTIIFSTYRIKFYENKQPYAQLYWFQHSSKAMESSHIIFCHGYNMDDPDNFLPQFTKNRRTLRRGIH